MNSLAFGQVKKFVRLRTAVASPNLQGKTSINELNFYTISGELNGECSK